MKEKYWHIQMHLPHGRDGGEIDCLEMLKQEKPVIGTGDWDDLQCRYFKGEEDGLQIGDIIMVRKGSHPVAICKITSDVFLSEELTKHYWNHYFRNVDVLDWAPADEWVTQFAQGTLKVLYKHSDTFSWNYINNWYKKTLHDMKDQEQKIVSLLKYKKQIILQGAPGTGKTYNAKLIAKELTKNQIYVERCISNEDIQAHLKDGMSVNSISGRKVYTIDTKRVADKIFVEGEDISSVIHVTFAQIIQAYKDKLWESGKSTNGTQPYKAALAKYIYDNVEHEVVCAEDDYVKLVQFHPSYSYEDFVRGIVVDTKDGIPNYINKDKLLGEFAKEALVNWRSAELYSTAKLNNYVLIIDEINRANLSSVLGELIYAMEYRGEEVESMYAIDEDNSLILPPNLYIIGTMNTADRSVGQIDYAMRRRFAFVDVLPRVLYEEELSEGETFQQDLFKDVSKLFIENIDEYLSDNAVLLKPSQHLSNEFRPEDVWIGHSYFIVKENNLSMRLNYEIMPILKEYLKDGILKESARNEIQKLK